MIAMLDRKLLRDLGALRGQVITIALVVAAGIATYVTLQGTWASLLYSRDAYYERHRFADVFARARRAPLSIVPRIEAIDGVARVVPRVSDLVSLPMPDEPEPASGQVLSIPADGSPPALNGLVIMRGRWPEPGRPEEVLVLDGFATARGIDPGETLEVILNGNERDLEVVGTALSPEHIFVTEPGNAMPEPDSFAVIWMLEDAARAAFRMEGAFNDVALRLTPGASEANVIDELDRILEPYGSFGALGRERQESNYVLGQELGQLESMATTVPIIFLAVAAFLLNVVLSRLIHLQRGQIAALKALGYDDRAIGIHYLKLVSVVVLIGAVLGTGIGVWLGREMTELYTDFFHFPVLSYRLDVEVVLAGVVISMIAGIVGAAIAVRSVVRLPPAEAMRPPAPAQYTRSLAERLGLLNVLGTSARMVFREITRRPLRLALSSLGIAMAVAIMVAGRFGVDAFDHLLDVVFQTSMTEDLAVTFMEPTPERAVRELEHLPGVIRAEGMRVVPVRFSNGPRFRDSMIWGRPPDLTMRTLADKDGRRVELQREGVLLSRALADALNLRVGDTIHVEIREGQRGEHDLPITGLIDDMYGLFGYMDLDALNRVMREGRSVSYVLLDVDPAAIDEVRTLLRDKRGVQGIARRLSLIERMRAQTGSMYLAMTLILTLFAATIAVGVVYNNARVALSLRSRDLASLRVLGFTRAEISAVLLGELAVQVLLAIPIGLWVGKLMAQALMSTADPERYRMEAIVSDRTYAFAALVTLAAGLVSGLLVRRELDHLDLIGVLKTRE